MARVEGMAERSPYSLAAYDFVLRGLDHTIRSLPHVRHVSGQELVHGIERFAKQEFGPLAKHVLNTWGLTRTRDFGEIVFQLVEAGILRKTEEDSLDDFVECFDFDQVFERDYYKDHPVFQD
jgi:uncharacterized repeat protein (TIGR04138 family)